IRLIERREEGQARAAAGTAVISEWQRDTAGCDLLAIGSHGRVVEEGPIVAPTPLVFGTRLVIQRKARATDRGYPRAGCFPGTGSNAVGGDQIAVIAAREENAHAF